MSDDVQAVLAAKREVLEAQIETMTTATPDTGGISFGKRVGEGTSIAVERLSQIAAHDRLQVTLTEVIRAQEKLRDGSYGSCDRCGKPVGDARLEAMPWANLCMACAERAQRRAAS